MVVYRKGQFHATKPQAKCYFVATALITTCPCFWTRADLPFMELRKKNMCTRFMGGRLRVTIFLLFVVFVCGVAHIFVDCATYVYIEKRTFVWTCHKLGFHIMCAFAWCSVCLPTIATSGCVVFFVICYFFSFLLRPLVFGSLAGY